MKENINYDGAVNQLTIGEKEKSKTIIQGRIYRLGEGLYLCVHVHSNLFHMVNLSSGETRSRDPRIKAELEYFELVEGPVTITPNN